jgi:hypothetical protein
MSMFRNDIDVETVEKGCPICHSDVKGNDVYLYFCKTCNILFRKEDLVLDKSVIEDKTVRKIIAKFDQDRDKIKLEPTFEETKLTENKKIILKELKESKKYYISRKSNILHRANCPYGKNIKRENKITLKTLDGTEHLKKCRCMTDQ